MSYENARSTILLATHCLLCGRPLRDVKSVEIGIGPVCRSRAGYDQDMDEADRMAANKLVHEAALPGISAEQRLDCADQIEALGMTGVADKIRKRFLKYDVVITVASVVFGKGNWAKTVKAYILASPFNEGFKDDFKAKVDFRDRAPVYENKRFQGWAFKGAAAKDTVHALLAEHFGGEWITGPKGAFRV
jgi:hypothetical protein